MNKLDVRILRLERLHVACAFGFGSSPEEEAWGRLLGWAAECGLAADPGQHRFFGFNNPSPSPGSPNYGYEQWMTVGPTAAEGGGVTIRDFDGGLYAVTRCEGLQNISTTWQQLAAWLEHSPYEMGRHQWLEECFTPRAACLEDYVFDLYMPIADLPTSST